MTDLFFSTMIEHIKAWMISVVFFIIDDDIVFKCALDTTRH